MTPRSREFFLDLKVNLTKTRFKGQIFESVCFQTCIEFLVMLTHKLKKLKKIDILNKLFC